MSHRLHHILFSVALILFVSGNLPAQENDYDRVLDRYETICERCLDLRNRVAAGEAVSQSTMVSLIEELGKLRTSIQETSGKMTPSQRARFEAIKNSYSPVRNPEPVVVKQSSAPARTVVASPRIKDPVSEPLTENMSRIARETVSLPDIENSVHCCIDRKDETDALRMQFLQLPQLAEVKNALPISFGALGTISLTSNTAFGASLFCSYGRLGLWLAGRTSPSLPSWSATVTSSGIIDGGGKFWGDGTSRECVKMALAGPLFNVTDFLSIYGGAGYGRYDLLWRSVDGTYCQVSDRSFTSCTIEAGLMFHISHLSVSVGLNRFGSYAATFGLGFNF